MKVLFLKFPFSLLVAAVLGSPLFFWNHKVSPDSPNISGALLSAPGAPGVDDELESAAWIVQDAVRKLPAWEESDLAPYEQDQLSAVRSDIAACVAADTKTPEEFLSKVRKLELDAVRLVAQDEALSRGPII